MDKQLVMIQNTLKSVLSAIMILLTVVHVQAQDSLLLKLAKDNMMKMARSEEGFSGTGWRHIENEVNSSQHVLIGEDHFTKEIPEFIEAVGTTSKFDNFYIEVDPYTTELLSKSFKMDEEQRRAFNNKYEGILSFYSLVEEYELLKKMVENGMNLLGSDQIVMYDDRILCDELASVTHNKEAKRIYQYISQQSAEHFANFLHNPQGSMMYMMTPDFEVQISKLKELELSKIEIEIIDKMMLSKEIYATQSHSTRVQLIKHHFMNDYPNWNRKRNLFKYGANHMARGESFLTVTDIGNLMANIAEANYEKSLHIMVLGESGKQASAFRTFPASNINPNGFYLKHLQLLFSITEGDDWHVFNLIPLREQLIKGKLQLENINLERTIKGFDILVLIPEVSPASFD